MEINKHTPLVSCNRPLKKKKMKNNELEKFSLIPGSTVLTDYLDITLIILEQLFKETESVREKSFLVKVCKARVQMIYIFFK